MNKEVTILTISRSKGFGFDEQSIMALLLLVGVIQIGCAFGAGSGLVKNDASGAYVVQVHDGAMLAKK